MKASEIATLLDGVLRGDANVEISGVAGLENAGPADLAFVDGLAALEQARRSAAGCFLVASPDALPEKTIIAVGQPKVALVKAARAILTARRVTPEIHPSAAIAQGARLSQDVSVGAHAVIEEGASLGARTCVGPGVFIGPGVEIGADCVIHPRVTLYADVCIGNRVVIHSGAVIGADGFGYVFTEGSHQKFPQLGRAVIEDDVEIGANTTVDRGSLGDTIIGQGSKIDNLVQIAHNVRVGRHCVIAAQTGIAGSARIGNYAMFGGQAGIGDRAHIGDQVIIGAQAGVLPGKSVRRGSALWGTPARLMSECKETYAHVAKLPKLARKVEELSQRLNALSK